MKKYGLFRLSYTQVDQLSRAEREELWQFTSRDVDRDRALFDSMLMSRDGVLRAWDRHGALRGCGALKVARFTLEGQRVACMWASLVAVHPSFRGNGILPLGVLRVVLAEILRHPGQRTYGIGALGSFSGYRAVANTAGCFWPSPDREMPPFERKVLDEAMSRLVPLVPGRRWVPERGIVETLAPEQWTGEPKTREAGAGSPLLELYHRMNPGQAKGDALAFLTPFNWANVLPMVALPLRNWNRRRVKQPN